VAALISSAGLAYVCRSLWSASQEIAGSIFLLDSVGELASTYALADIAFVGGSLVSTGGHNILEPAQYGTAIVVGPHTFNFREIVSIFEQGRAIKVVTNETLASEWLDLLNQPGKRRDMGKRAKELFEQHAGATRRTLDALAPLLARKPRDAQ
jgi:3-deoxy-D-manno-octulosonic-acid transferase